MVVAFTHGDEKVPHFNKRYSIVIIADAFVGFINELAEKLVLLDVLLLGEHDAFGGLEVVPVPAENLNEEPQEASPIDFTRELGLEGSVHLDLVGT